MIASTIIGSFSQVEYPLSVVQIDHTLVDIILADPIKRLPICRPYLTIAIDIYSRCVPGFVLSLEAPSTISVRLCLTHIAMDKKAWLAEHNIDASWPIHGKPYLIHVYNGPDFHTRGIAFRSLTEKMDTTTPHGELLFSLFGALAQYERALIKERIMAGLEAAKRRGKKGG